MAAFSVILPPPHYVKPKRAWLRLGQFAVVGVLAALAIAGGVLLPQAPTAEAQGNHNGYTYTQRVCQELGQQPRHYNVRDPMPGSDWRNDGGWAIVLINGVNTAPAEYRIHSLNQQGAFGNSNGALNQLRTASTLGLGSVNTYTFRKGDYIRGINGVNGWATAWGTNVVIDRNRNGIKDTGDTYHAGGWWRYQGGQWALVNPQHDYNTHYVRWANMLWCR